MDCRGALRAGEGEVMGRIPKHVLDDAKEGVEDMRFYGVPVTELSHDELLACVSSCIKSQMDAFRRFEEYRKFLNGFPSGVRVGSWTR